MQLPGTFAWSDAVGDAFFTGFSGSLAGSICTLQAVALGGGDVTIVGRPRSREAAKAASFLPGQALITPGRSASAAGRALRSPTLRLVSFPPVREEGVVPPPGKVMVRAVRCEDNDRVGALPQSVALRLEHEADVVVHLVHDGFVAHPKALPGHDAATPHPGQCYLSDNTVVM